MRFRAHYTSPTEYYAVGIDQETQKPVMEVTITGLGWYTRYYRLTDAEIDAFNADHTALDRLARAFAADKGLQKYADRLIE